MLTYIIMAILSIIFAHLYEKQKSMDVFHTTTKYIKAQKKDYSLEYTLLVLSAIPFILVSGVRYRVGTDFMYYSDSFTKFSEGKPGYFSDPLYWVVQCFVSVFTNQYVWMSIACSIIIMTLYWITFHKLSSNTCYSIFLFLTTTVFFVTLNGVRQGLSIAVLFYSIVWILKRNKKCYIITVICATMFHTSAIIFLPMYWIYNFKIDLKKMWALLMVVFVVGMTGEGLFDYILSFTKYRRYINSMFDVDSFELILVLINTSVLFVLAFYYKKALSFPDHRKYTFLMWMQIITVAALLISAAIPLSNRVAWIFSTGQLLALPMLSKYENSKIGTLILNGGIIILFFLSMYVGIGINGSHKVVPYQTVFF